MSPDPQSMAWEQHCSWVMDAAGFTPAEREACLTAFSTPTKLLTRDGWFLIVRYYEAERDSCPGEFTELFLDGARYKAVA